MLPSPAGPEGKWWTAAELRRLAADPNATALPANATTDATAAATAAAAAAAGAARQAGDAGGRLSVRIEGLDESRNNV